MAYNSVDLTFIEDGDAIADHIVSFWEDWDTQKRVAKDRWNETRQFVDATSTRETSNAHVGGEEGDGGWSHSTHIPKITQIRDNLIANYEATLFPNSDYIKFESFDEQAATAEKRQAVEAYIKTKHRLNNFEPTISKLIADWVDYGNCFAEVYYTEETHQDPQTEQTISTYLGPKIKRISPFDIVFNPIAESFDASPKIIRSVYSLGDFRRTMQEDPARSYYEEVWDKIKDNRRQIREGGYSSDDIDKYSQLRFDGFGSVAQYFNSGYVEVLDFYGDIYDQENDELLKNHLVTVVDRKFVIRKKPLNTWSGRPNIFHAGWRFRHDNLWAMGPLDNLVGMQYYINHLENARADAFDMMVFPDTVFEGEVKRQQREGSPVVEYIIPEAGGGRVYHLAPDTTILQADFQIKQKEQQMEEFAGAPKEAMGIRSPGEKTAYEVQQLTTAASRLFQHKVQQFERLFLEPVINAEIELGRYYLDTTDIVQIIDTDTGVQQFLSVTRQDLKSNGKIVPIGARHFAERQRFVQELTQTLQFIEGTEISQHFPTKKLAQMIVEELDWQKYDLYVPFGRIAEQVEARQLAQTAQDQLQDTKMIGEQQRGRPIQGNSADVQGNQRGGEGQS